MTPLVRAIANLPEKQVILMVKILITHQIAELVATLKDGISNQKNEVEKIPNLEVVQVLPDTEQQEISVMCAKALEIIAKMTVK